MNISYEINKPLSSEDFIDILQRSTLGKRRPIENEKCIQGMLDHVDIVVVAMENEEIIAIARAISDFNYACYLSDLAVDIAYQKKGIGKKLIELVKDQLEEGCKIILFSAPDARAYYPKVGFTAHDSAWTCTTKNEL